MLTDFEAGLARVIAEYVDNYRFFQTDEWFSMSCEFRKNKDGPANVTDLMVNEQKGT